MPISLRIPPEKEEMIKRVAVKTGKTKTALILEAVDEKLGLVKKRKIKFSVLIPSSSFSEEQLTKFFRGSIKTL